MDVSPSAVVPVTPRPKSDASIDTHFGAFGARRWTSEVRPSPSIAIWCSSSLVASRRGAGCQRVTPRPWRATCSR